MIFVGQTAVKVLQSWILLHISTRINVSLDIDSIDQIALPTQKITPNNVIENLALVQSLLSQMTK